MFATPGRGREIDHNRAAAILPDPVQIGKELALVKEQLQDCLLGKIGTAGVKCCQKTIGKCDAEARETTKQTLPEDTPFFLQLHGLHKGHPNTVLDYF